jgi:L-fucose mutarotase
VVKCLLKGKLIHPEILAALGSAGHGSKVLIADGNYPFSTASSKSAKIVFLNLMPGIVKVPDVLEAIVSAIPIEAAEVMMPDSGPKPEIFEEFKKLLPVSIKLVEHGRSKFYDVAREGDVALVIATGEQRVYANLLLTIGVVR